MSEITNQGIYIVKTYFFDTKKNIIPIIKFGYTKNIKKRLKYFGDSYKLIKFYQCDFPEWREKYIKNNHFSDEFRISRSEHFIYESGLLKYIDESIKDSLEFKLKKLKSGWIQTIQ